MDKCIMVFVGGNITLRLEKVGQDLGVVEGIQGSITGWDDPG